MQASPTATSRTSPHPALSKSISPPSSPFSLAFVFLCDLLQSESKIAETNRRSPGKRSLDRVFDLAIIGGGINGCGIARDAAGRGNSVFLCEMNDLASGTSSWSTKLVHGGLRYLEYYEFRLVREALIEREILWQIAPHIIRPLAFRFAAPRRPAPGLAAAAGVVPVRSYRRPQSAAADALGRSRPRRGGKTPDRQPLPQGL